jgi:fused signal recognition particle receptor
MTYTIIAIVVLVVVVLFVLISRRSSGGEAQPPEKPASLPTSQAKAARPAAASAARAEAKPAEAAKEPAAASAARPSAARQPAVAEPEPEAPPAPPRDLTVLRKGLAKARGDGGFLGRLATLFAGKKEIDPAIADQVEEILLTSDVGVATTQAILSRLRDGLGKNELQSSQAVWDALRADAKRILGIGGGKVAVSHKPEVIFMVGVNGVGKTTTIGKLASKFKSEGRSVLLAAGDTFRAAAVQQLEVWGKRIGCEVVKGKEGADPGAVIFDAIQKAKQTGIEVVLADTAGRLQTKTPLMDELKKIARTMQKAMEGAPHETLLVLDATNGQNAVSQAKMFQEAIALTGIVLTKLDGTAKGGVILGITDELKIPVRYVGLGERADDLREFNADEFVEALFGASAEETAAA